MNYNLELLYEAAERFGFVVDRRGVWPVMIMGQKAAIYHTHRDMLHFISKTHPHSTWEALNLLHPAKFPSYQQFVNTYSV